MSKIQKMELKINSSPHFEMSDITKQLFNCDFYSDIQFSVQGKIIYAHSLELIKRSVIFEQQLGDKLGEKKLIPIDDCKYENFFEFIRFIYTDECDINVDNFIEILKLATKYQVIKLENRVINSDAFAGELKFFEHCICAKYELAQNFVKQVSTGKLASYLKDQQFISLHPDAVEELLKFERVEEHVTEVNIFVALAEWISSRCKMHQITLSEGRQRWDKLIRKIRFPAMTNSEIGECYKKYPGLLSENDCMSIARLSIFGAGHSEKELWISKARDEFIWPTICQQFNQDEDNKTTFFVSKDTILYGLRIGIELKRKPVEIEILEADDKTNVSQKLTFSQTVSDYWFELMISLGESLRLKPNCKYTISIKYLETIGNCKVTCRKEITNVIINDPDETVNLIQASPNMLEMFFKPAED